jgi:hypothetical protein
MSANQTQTLSPLGDGALLPFRVEILTAPFRLGLGVHSYSLAVWKHYWLLVGGRTNGLHGFLDPPAENFPSASQNTNLVVVDWRRGATWTRSLNDAKAGLTPLQVCQLSSTAAQTVQDGKWLYVVGGYGIDPDGNYVTFDSLTRLHVRRTIAWVRRQRHGRLVRLLSQRLGETFHVTGGRIYWTTRSRPTLLAMGQTFTGRYYDSTNGVYTKTVRRFKLGGGRHVETKTLKPLTDEQPYYRRRDLNILPLLERRGRRKRAVVLSGVFTPDTGVWTVPVEISSRGRPLMMGDPDAPVTLKQGMNNYNCASTVLYAASQETNYALLMGGLSYLTWNGTAFVPDVFIPFTNQCTVVRRRHGGQYDQFFLSDCAYPDIPSTTVNPGNTLLFGTAARFVPDPSVPKQGPRNQIEDDVIDLDRVLRRSGSTRIGWVVGGMVSTLPDTNFPSDSFSSDHVFEVWVSRR